MTSFEEDVQKTCPNYSWMFCGHDIRDQAFTAYAPVHGMDLWLEKSTHASRSGDVWRASLSRSRGGAILGCWQASCQQALLSLDRALCQEIETLNTLRMTCAFGGREG